ncbi:hypothetical protein BP00DRAFT_235892 [Aspergillus indologenus CBS 114.80]|uniref:Uncharacterized protein n=1 Tax=Aspergillus indologenus CBS 114.80 TaxID=1450541 RepID=A0A2V5IJP2_9EURO|nr:hypothetical protein BP00DRAFT_235892 [Aspergillus indologenus CBS 114.80]
MVILPATTISCPKIICGAVIGSATSIAALLQPSFIRVDSARRPNFQLVAQFQKSVDEDRILEDANWMVIENAMSVMAECYEIPEFHPRAFHGSSIEKFVADLEDFTIGGFEPFNRALSISQPLRGHSICNSTTTTANTIIQNLNLASGKWNSASRCITMKITTGNQSSE